MKKGISTALALATLATGAQAADVLVGTGQSIQTAIDGANPNDVIVLTDTTTAYTQEVNVTKNLTIRTQTGAPAKATIAVPATPTQTAGVWVAAGVTATFENIAFDGAANTAGTVQGIELFDGTHTTIADCEFRNADRVTILHDVSGTTATTLVVSDSTFDGAGRRHIEMGANSAASGNALTVTGCTLLDAGSKDAILVEEFGNPTIVIQDSTIDGADDEGIQVTAADGTSLIEGNVIQNTTEDGIQIERPPASTHATTIRNNTIYNIRNGINIDGDDNSPTGAVTIEYNIVAEWEDEIPGDPEDGYAISNFTNQTVATQRYNVLVDPDDTATEKDLLNVTLGANSVSLVEAPTATVLVSTTPGPDYLHIKTTGPAFNIDGANNNAGAIPVSPAAVGDWSSFD